MKTCTISLYLAGLLLCTRLNGQSLDVTLVNSGANTIQVIGTATAPGFTAGAYSSWSTMNLTVRIPKTAATPQPTVAPPASTPEITAEATSFTALDPRDVWSSSLDLTMFDLTTFGLSDDGYWYMQMVNTDTGNVQAIPAGGSVVLYEFVTPIAWSCVGCVELVMSDIPGLPIGTTSYIDNSGTGSDVLLLTTNMAPLPIELVYFDGEAEGRKNRLEWTTVSETNNDFFTLERSKDAANFEEAGIIDGAGNSNQTLNYHMYDENPYFPVTYYRLKQTDFDGEYSYSEVVAIQNYEGGEFNAGELYPNPTDGKFYIDLNIPVATDVILDVCDVDGKSVFRRNYSVSGEQKIEVDGSAWAAGVYLVKVTDSQGAQVIRKLIRR